MLMIQFDEDLIRASFSFVYFLQFYLLNFLTFFNGGLNPQASPVATPLSCCYRAAFAVACSRRLTESEELDNEGRSLCDAQVCVQRCN